MERKSLTKLITLFLLLTLALTGCFTQKNDVTSVANDSNAKRAFSSAFATLNVRGTFNNWTSTPMVLVANNSWKVTVAFAGTTSTERFKFDVKGDWGQNYGDNATRDGIADQNGSDIPVIGGKTYDITFNEITRAYTVVEAATKKTVQVYASIDGIGFNYGINGVKMNIFKTADLTKVVTTAAFTGSTEGNSVFVPNLDPGTSYKIVVAQDADLYYSGAGSVKQYVTGEAIFVTTTAAFQPSVNVALISTEAKRNVTVEAFLAGGVGITTDLLGKTIKLYKDADNTLVASQSITMRSASTTGVYFTKLDANTKYRAVIDEVATFTFAGKARATASAIFTTNALNADQTLVNLTVYATPISDRSINLTPTIESVVRANTGNYVMGGLNINLYKTSAPTVLVSTTAIIVGKGGSYVDAYFYNLDASTEYRAEIAPAYVRDDIRGFRIWGVAVFTTTAENIAQPKTNVSVFLDDVLAHGDVNMTITGLTAGQGMSGYSSLLYGMVGKVYKDGVFWTDKVVTSGEASSPCFHFDSLDVGSYEIKFDATDAKTAYKYTGNTKFTITADLIAKEPLLNNVYMTVTETKKSFFSSVPSAYFRGTPNNWGAKLMDLVADETWTTTVVTGATATERFKIDIKGDWSENYGLNGVKGGSDIPLKANTTYVITFKADTKAISYVEQSAKVTQYANAQVVESGFTISNPDKNSFARGCTVDIYDATNVKVTTGTLVGSQVNFPNLDNGKTYTAKINETKTLTDPAYPTGAFEFTANQTFVASGTANLTLTVNVKQVVLKDVNVTFTSSVTPLNFADNPVVYSLAKDVIVYLYKNGNLDQTGKLDGTSIIGINFNNLERGANYTLTVPNQIITVTNPALPVTGRIEIAQFYDQIFRASIDGKAMGPFNISLNATYLPSDVTVYFGSTVTPFNFAATPATYALAKDIVVELYKGSQFIERKTLGGTPTIGTSFSNLERGTQYKIVVPEQTIRNYSAELAGKYIISAVREFPFATPKDTNVKTDNPIDLFATKIIECDYSFHGSIANTEYVATDMIADLTVKLYKDGATTVTTTATITRSESSVFFYGLKPGTYKAVVDEVRYNSSYYFATGDVKYKGEMTFTIDAEGKPTVIPAPGLPILLTAIKYQASIYLRVPTYSYIDLKGSSIAVTNPSGVVKNYVLGGGNFYNEFCADLTDLTSAGTYRVVYNKTTTGAIVTADFTFTLTSSQPSTSPVTEVTITNIEKKKNFTNLYERGTNNGWTTTAMTLTADYTWSVTITTGSTTSERFKFDVKGDWSQNYGDTNKDGIGDINGSDIILAANSTYDITFNDSTLKYTVTKK